MMQRVIEGDRCRILASEEIVERFQADVDDRQQWAQEPPKDGLKNSFTAQM